MADTTGSGTGDSGSNMFERQYGGLPMWSWMAIALGVLLILQYYRSQSSSSSSTTQAAAGTGSGQQPFVILMPQGPVAPTPASNTVASVPTVPASPSPNPMLFGFAWMPYKVLGLQPTRGTQADTSPIGIAQIAYGLNRNDEANAAYLASLIVQNNPGVDFSKPLSTGTVVQIPQLDLVPPGATATQFN